MGFQPMPVARANKSPGCFHLPLTDKSPMLRRAFLLLACLSIACTAALAKDSDTAGKVLKEARPIPPVPPRKDVPIDEKLQSAARAELDRALESPDPVIRGHAIEAMQQLFGSKARQDFAYA